MGFQAPSNAPVPIVLVEPLGLRLGCWAMFVSLPGVVEIAIFAKDQGAPDWTAIGGGVVLNLSEDSFKEMIDRDYGGDEMKWAKTISEKLNTQLDEWLRQNYQWEQLQGATLKSDVEIDAMRSEVDQVNWKLAKYAGFWVNAEKKTIDFSVT